MNDYLDEDAQERIIKLAYRCKPALDAYAYGLLRDYSEAQDVVQEALIVVMKQYEKFEEGSSMIAWTRAIVRRKIMQSMDRRKRQARLEDRLLHDAVDAAFEQIHKDTRAEDLYKMQALLAGCLEQLSERSRQLLNLVYMKKSSYAEISQATSMSLEAIGKALYRAKQQLRQCVALKAGAES